MMPTTLALEGLKAAGSTDPADVMKALPSVSYDGITGTITFDETGDAKVKTAYVKSVDNETGTWVGGGSVHHGRIRSRSERDFSRHIHKYEMRRGPDSPAGFMRLRLIGAAQPRTQTILPRRNNMSFIQENLPFLLAGISVGGQYALIAIGYTMVYGISAPDQLRPRRCVHGGGPDDGLPAVPACRCTWRMPLVIILTVLLGFVIERVAYKPLRSAPRMSRHDLRHRRQLSAAEPGALRHRRPAPDLPHHPLDLSETVTIVRRHPPRW